VSRPPTRVRHLHAVTAPTDTVASEGATSDATPDTPTAPVTFPPSPVLSGFHDPELEEAIARHPASSTQWRDVDILTIRHLSLPELLEVCNAFELELRIQTRRSTPR